MERINDILGYESLKIYQNSEYFSFSLDSIFLANYSTVRLRDKKIIDFCTGNGVVPFVVSFRTKSKIIGIDIQEKLINLANCSLELNNLNNQISFICEDINDYSKKHLNEFDLVLCNPPYFKVEENSTFNDSYEKMIARHEVKLNLDELCECAMRVLKDHGNFSLVHRSDRLIEILETLKKYKLEPKKIKFLHETINKPSYLVLIESQKCGKVGLKVEEPFIQYNLDGSMADEYSKMLKEVRK